MTKISIVVENRGVVLMRKLVITDIEVELAVAPLDLILDRLRQAYIDVTIALKTRYSE
jgi:hypothetical protein